MGEYINKRVDCKFYEGCNAPLCPMLSNEDNKKYIWYPDEEICRRVKDVPNWIKQQRKIAKKANPDNDWFYFTIDMLKVNFRVTKSVKGIDPNEEDFIQLKQWFKRNKGTKKRTISEKQKRQKIIDLKKARDKKMQKQIDASSENGAEVLSETPHAYQKMRSETLTLIKESEV